MLGDNPDDLGCLERLKEVDFAMGLLLRTPVESPRSSADRPRSPVVEDYGARDASPMPRGEGEVDDDEDDDEDDLDGGAEEHRWQSPEPRRAPAPVHAAAQSPRSSPDVICPPAKRPAAAAMLATPSEAERDADEPQGTAVAVTAAGQEQAGAAAAGGGADVGVVEDISSEEEEDLLENSLMRPMEPEDPSMSASAGSISYDDSASAGEGGGGGLDLLAQAEALMASLNVSAESLEPEPEPAAATGWDRSLVVAPAPAPAPAPTSVGGASPPRYVSGVSRHLDGIHGHGYHLRKIFVLV